MTVTTWPVDLYAVACALLLAFPGAAGAASHPDAAPEPPQARMLARAYGLGPLGPNAPAGTPVEVELHLRGSAIRIDFRGEHAPDAWLTTQGRGTQAWLVSERDNYVLPVPDASGPYWYDPAAPCRSMGGRCEPAPGEFILGRLTAGWRYSNADGPDGTRTGTLWIDTQTGLMLAYRGRAGISSRERGMRAAVVTFEDVASDVFELPTALRRPDRVPAR